MRRIAFLTICCLALGCSNVDQSPPATQATPANAVATEEDSSAGMSLEHYYAGAGPETIAAKYPYDLAVTGRVKSVANVPATHEHPPAVTIRVDQILDGKPTAEEIRVVWQPFPHDVDWGIPEKEPRYLKWAKMPMTAPQNGEQYILLLSAEEGEGQYACASIARFPLTPENLEQVRIGLNQRGESDQ